MVKYSKEFKEQALLLSDEIGVKKVGEQLEIQELKKARLIWGSPKSLDSHFIF